jgi:hypothetical protein
MTYDYDQGFPYVRDKVEGQGWELEAAAVWICLYKCDYVYVYMYLSIYLKGWELEAAEVYI